MVYWPSQFNGERSISINHREKGRALHINESDHHKAENEESGEWENLIQTEIQYNPIKCILSAIV